MLSNSKTLNLNICKTLSFLNVFLFTGTGLQTGDRFELTSRDEHLAIGEFNSSSVYTGDGSSSSTWDGTIRVLGKFLGKDFLYLEIHKYDKIHLGISSCFIATWEPVAGCK